MSSVFTSSIRPRILLSTRFTAVRFTARTKQKKISVQLLKNIEGLGVKGEIVQVKPTHMMNWLQFQNRACFVLPGQAPKIPVVDRTKEFKRLEEERRKAAAVLLQEKKKMMEVEDSKKIKLEDLKKITGLKFGN